MLITALQIIIRLRTYFNMEHIESNGGNTVYTCKGDSAQFPVLLLTTEISTLALSTASLRIWFLPPFMADNTMCRARKEEIGRVLKSQQVLFYYVANIVL